MIKWIVVLLFVLNYNPMMPFGASPSPRRSAAPSALTSAVLPPHQQHPAGRDLNRCRDVPPLGFRGSRGGDAGSGSVRSSDSKICSRRNVQVLSSAGWEDCAHHWSKHRDREGDGPGPGDQRGPGHHGVPRRGEGGGGCGQHTSGVLQSSGGGSRAGPGRHLLHTNLRTEIPERGQPASHPHQQRWRDDVSLHEDRGWFRDAHWSQSFGPLPVDVPPHWAHEAQRCGSDCGRLLSGAQLRLDPFPRPPQPGQLQQRTGVLPEQTGQRAVRQRARSQTQRHRRDGEFGPPGDGELGPDETLDAHDDTVHGLLHVPEDPAGRSSNQHILGRGGGAALDLWETLQRLHARLCGASGKKRGHGEEAVGRQLRAPRYRVGLTQPSDSLLLRVYLSFISVFIHFIRFILMFRIKQSGFTQEALRCDVFFCKIITRS